MRSDDHTGSPGSGVPPRAEDSGVSRRSLLRTAAGAGVAGLAASTVAGTVLAGPALAAPVRRGVQPGGERAGERGGSEPVVVHVRDISSGEMDVFAGTSQTRFRDPDLAARLMRAIR